MIDSFNDPKVQGVTCYISRAQTGGVRGALGVAEDTSDASIACRQVGPVKILGELKDGERVFDERRSLLFKRLEVVRFFDRERNVLVYVAYSERVIEGSPKNSISVVPIMGWTDRRFELRVPFCRFSGAGRNSAPSPVVSDGQFGAHFRRSLRLTQRCETKSMNSTSKLAIQAYIPESSA